MGKLFFISGNTPSLKNSKSVFNGRIIESKTVTKWRHSTVEEWMNQIEEFTGLLSSIEKPYYIEFTFIRNSKRSFDYINAAQVVLDMMVTFGWLEDDNADIVKPYFGDYKYNKLHPGVEIRILGKKPNHYSKD